MKSTGNQTTLRTSYVTLHVRVWIEMREQRSHRRILEVTLHVRVWIEMSCGIAATHLYLVTLHVRVWIEMAHPDGIGIF